MGKAEILQQWLNKANDDLRSAEYLSTMHYPTPDEIICFHCQQSAEKYLKAFLFLHDIEPEKTHDLEELLRICQEHNTSFSSLLAKLQIKKTHMSMKIDPFVQEDRPTLLIGRSTCFDLSCNKIIWFNYCAQRRKDAEDI